MKCRILRRVFVVLLICSLFGCGETEESESETSVVTIEFVGYQDVDKAQFILRAKPYNENLTVLFEFVSEGKEPFHVWKVISRPPGSLKFTVALDASVPWEVSILPFWNENIKDYPLTDIDVSSENELIRYELGDPYKVNTVPYTTLEEEETFSIPEGMVLIPEGEFRMGSDQGGEEHKDEQPIHTVYVDAFYMDIHEVTIGEYKKFVEETGHPDILDWVVDRSPTDQHPVIGISWYDAMEYARWVGKRLPTEAEWEYAARGGLSQEKYPWGNDEPDGTQCNYADKNVAGLVWNFDGEEQLITWADEDVDDGYTHNAPVGSYIPNGYGLYDMAGNVWEWCLDVYDPNFYTNSPRENPIAGATLEDTIVHFENISTARVFRGGSYASDAEGVRVAHRGGNLPLKRFNDLGFRCVLPVDSDLSNLGLRFE